MSDETISRRRQFAQVPDELTIDPRLSHLAVRVWLRLDKYAGKDGRAFPSRATLAADLHVSKGGIARALAELTAAGWITRKPIHRGGVCNTTLNDTSTVPLPVTTEAPTTPVPHVRRGGVTGETGASHGRDGEGYPPKDTQQGDGPRSDYGLPAGRALRTRRSSKDLQGPALDEAWAWMKELCGWIGEEDPYSVWWTLRYREKAHNPAAWLSARVEAGQWDGYVGSHGIDVYERPSKSA